MSADIIPFPRKPVTPSAASDLFDEFLAWERADWLRRERETVTINDPMAGVRAIANLFEGD